MILSEAWPTGVEGARETKVGAGEGDGTDWGETWAGGSTSPDGSEGSALHTGVSAASGMVVGRESGSDSDSSSACFSSSTSSGVSSKSGAATSSWEAAEAWPVASSASYEIETWSSAVTAGVSTTGATCEDGCRVTLLASSSARQDPLRDRRRCRRGVRRKGAATETRLRPSWSLCKRNLRRPEFAMAWSAMW